MKGSNKRLRSTRPQPPKTAEARVIELLERENAALQRQNAKLLRMVEMVMEERFYRPVVTGGIRDNAQVQGLPIESLSDVAIFDEGADAAAVKRQEELFTVELNSIEEEHQDWRRGKGIHADDSTNAAA